MTRRARRLLWSRSLLVAAAIALACGREAEQELDDFPQRIIAVAPSVTEMLFELGLGDYVVGVGDYAEWPPEAASKPRLGGLFDARLEIIAGLDPDLAILLPSEERLRLNLEQMGIEVLTVRSDTLQDVEEMAMTIAARCGVPVRGGAFQRRWRAELAPRPLPAAVRVLLSINRERGRMADLLVGGPGTFLAELLDRMGAVNVMADASLAYPQVGLEEILIREPEVVIELQAAPGIYESLYQDWQQLGDDSPLSRACIQVVAGDYVLIPGPRVPRLYRELSEAIMECGEAR